MENIIINPDFNGNVRSPTHHALHKTSLVQINNLL